MTTIVIEWNFGRPRTGAEDDEDRAIVAAEKVLDAAGVDYEKAEDEYQRQLVKFDDEAPMTGHALIWIKAHEAAELALTQGWHDPNGASCSIRTV